MLTRRAALKGGTATVAAIAAGGAVAARVAVDGPLLDLEQQWLRQRHYANHEQPGETDEERLARSLMRARRSRRLRDLGELGISNTTPLDTGIHQAQGSQT